MGEYENHALYGLWLACVRYDESIAKFSTYAYPVIYGMLQNAHKEIWKPATREKQTKFALGIIEGRPESEVVDVENREILSPLLSRLGGRYRRVVELRYGLINGKAHTLEETSEILHVTRERVRQIQVRALIQMRKGCDLDKISKALAIEGRGHPAKRTYSDEDANDNPWRDYAVRVREDMSE